jgi:hypothetical protein
VSEILDNGSRRRLQQKQRGAEDENKSQGWKLDGTCVALGSVKAWMAPYDTAKFNGEC